MPAHSRPANIRNEKNRIPLVALIGVAVVGIVLLANSPNWQLWAYCLIALPALVWLAGGQHSYAVLIWLLGYNWLQVIGSVAFADLTGRDIGFGGDYGILAIEYSLGALLVLAAGLTVGRKLASFVFGFGKAQHPDELNGAENAIKLKRVLACYFAVLPLSEVLGLIATETPTIAQPVLAFAMLKYVFVYLVAAYVFHTKRGAGWLALVFSLEVAMGVVGYFAYYKEAFFVILIAFASSRIRLQPWIWISGVLALLLIVWISLVWTMIKHEYRSEIFAKGLSARMEFVTDKLLFEGVDTTIAAAHLADRIGYTKYFAVVLERQNNGFIPELNLYNSAIEHVIKPRVLFPNKASLNDSLTTTLLTGMHVASNTSIGVGYIAEAYVDYGFPFMFVPIGLIGIFLGAGVQFVMTRRAPRLIREAVTTAIFFSLFRFETNIDKALGFSVTVFIALLLFLIVIYPQLAQWMAGRSRRRAIPASMNGRRGYSPHDYIDRR